jgi:hypothetical protein
VSYTLMGYSICERKHTKVATEISQRPINTNFSALAYTRFRILYHFFLVFIACVCVCVCVCICMSYWPVSSGVLVYWKFRAAVVYTTGETDKLRGTKFQVVFFIRAYSTFFHHSFTCKLICKYMSLNPQR